MIREGAAAGPLWQSAALEHALVVGSPAMPAQLLPGFAARLLSRWLQYKLEMLPSNCPSQACQQASPMDLVHLTVQYEAPDCVASCPEAHCLQVAFWTDAEWTKPRVTRQHALMCNATCVLCRSCTTNCDTLPPANLVSNLVSLRNDVFSTGRTCFCQFCGHSYIILWENLCADQRCHQLSERSPQPQPHRESVVPMELGGLLCTCR